MKSAVGGDGRSEKQQKEGYRLGIEIMAVLSAFILAVIGIGITDFRPMVSYRYWGAMTLILALTGIVIGWGRQKRLGLSVRDMLFSQLVHWISTLAVVGGIFLLLDSGRLNYENTGLVVLLVLALATFLDGYRVNWGFGALGIMLFLTALLGAYIEQYIWLVLIIIICTAVVIIILEKASFKVTSMKKDALDENSSESSVENAKDGPLISN